MLHVRRVPRAVGRPTVALTALESTTALGLAHALAGGEAPGLLWLGLIALTSYAAGTLVLRRRVSWRVAAPALVGVQLLLHAWLVVLGAGQAHVHGATSGPLGLSWPMVGAHVVAGLAASIAWRLRQRAIDLVLTLDEAPRIVVVLGLQPAPDGPRRPAPRLLLSVAPTRGPPHGMPATA